MYEYDLWAWLQNGFRGVAYGCSVWARDSQVPSFEVYLYYDPDYHIEAYALWFFQNLL